MNTPLKLDQARLRPHLRKPEEPQPPAAPTPARGYSPRRVNHPRALQGAGVKILSRNRGRLLSPPLRPANTFPPRTTRKEVLRKCQHKCYLCNRQLVMATLEVDHVIAVARGGSNAPANLLASCRPCNQLKTDHIVAFSIKTRRPHFIPW